MNRCAIHRVDRCAIHGAEGKGRAGLSAIELMVALALSMIILLVAVAAFRMASTGMGRLNRLSDENALLRTGWFIATEDADFWRSSADPRYPYAKGFMSDAVVIGDDKGNNHANKRIFKPVTFRKGDVASDPNWLQPNDRRSWYRNHVVQGPRPLQYDKADSFRPRQLYGTEKATDRAVYPKVQVGWEPWHVWGDYSPLGNTGETDGRPSDPLGGPRPLLMWNLFKQLGHAGVYTYMPPGTLNLLLRPSTNLTVAAIGQSDLNFDKGEVPWALTVPKASAKNPWGYEPGSVTVPDLPDNVLGHYFYAMPGRSGVRCDTNWAACGSGLWIDGWWQWRPATAGFSSPENHWLADLEQINGGYDQAIALLLGARLVAKDLAGTTVDAALVDASTADPWRSLGRTTIWDIDQNQRTSQNNAFWQQERDFTSTTVQLPRNRTDAPNPRLDDKPATMPALMSSIMRVRYKGADRAVCTVRLMDPTGGVVQEYAFSVVGTTLRGARQHWGRISRYDEPALKDIGDGYK